jgi:hypothetical protein
MRELPKLNYEKHFWQNVLPTVVKIRLGIATYSRQSSYFTHSKYTEILTVPVHANQDLKIGTLSRLLKDAHLTDRDF